MKRTLCWVLIMGLIISLGILGCGKKEEKEIKIGAILPLTGDGAVYGEKIKKGIQQGLEELNQKNGVKGKKVSIIYEDDKLDPKGGLNAFQKLSQVDKVPIIIGPISSGVVLTIAPKANETKTVVLSPYASNYKITDAGDYIFRIYPSDSVQGVEGANLANRLSYKKGAILYINSDYGVGLKEIFQKEFAKAGGKILISEGYDTGTTDFRGSLTKIKAVAPEFIYMPGNAVEMARILLQARELRIKTQFISTDAFLDETILKTARVATEGVMFTTLKENRDETFKNFASKFKTKYNEKPGLLESLGYDSFNVTALAIEKGGFTAEGIKNALYGIQNYKGVTGLISFDRNGDVSKPFAIKKIINGKTVSYED